LELPLERLYSFHEVVLSRRDIFGFTDLAHPRSFGRDGCADHFGGLVFGVVRRSEHVTNRGETAVRDRRVSVVVIGRRGERVGHVEAEGMAGGRERGRDYSQV
jgi:hypothetical protein